MDRLDVDFLPKKGKKNKDKAKNNKLFKIIIIPIILIVILITILSSSMAFSDNGLVGGLSGFKFLQQMGKLITSGNKALVGEEVDRINGLVIGMGGKNHQGGTLADTIILVSFKPSTNQVALMSIPRDLSIPIEGGQWMKINAVHAYAELDEPGSGGSTMIEALENLLETEIGYYITVDFDGFEKIIDEFGGVDINVERDLIDNEYPIRGKEYVYPIENRYETLRINSGPQHMDGELALKYVRSRHAIGIEGSDFARSARQQKLLAAMKEKVLSVNTFFSPKRIKSLLDAYNEHIMTNMEIWEMLKVAQISKEIDTANIISQTLTDGPSGLLYPKIINGAYVLLPDDGNFEQIKKIWQNIFYLESEADFSTDAEPASDEVVADQTNEPVKDIQEQTEETNKINEVAYQNDGATIEIRNGTWTNGWAGQEQNNLEEIGMTVIKVANADHHEYEQTIIYDFSNGSYPATQTELEKIYKISTDSPPANFGSEADFLIILGGQ